MYKQYSLYVLLWVDNQLQSNGCFRVCKDESNSKGKAPCALHVLSVNDSTQNMFPSIKVTSVQTKFFPRVYFRNVSFYVMVTILKNYTNFYFQNALFIAFCRGLIKL